LTMMTSHFRLNKEEGGEIRPLFNDSKLLGE